MLVQNQNLPCILPPKLKQYSVVQFSPHQILMQHKATHRKYQYRELANDESYRAFMQRAKARGEGFVEVEEVCRSGQTVGIVYQRWIGDVHSQLQRRIRLLNRNGTINYSLLAFTEEELLNTFMPVFKTLRRLHSMGAVNGSLRARNIVFTQNDEIKLCDPYLQAFQEESSQEPIRNSDLSPENDLWELGVVILQCVCLENIQGADTGKVTNQLQVHQCLDKFSEEFVIGMKLLLNTEKNLRKKAYDVLLDHNPPKTPQIQQLRLFRSKRKKINNDSLTVPNSPITKLKKAQKQNSQKLKPNFKIIKCRRSDDEIAAKMRQINTLNKIIEKGNLVIDQFIEKDKKFSQTKRKTERNNQNQRMKEHTIKTLRQYRKKHPVTTTFLERLPRTPKAHSKLRSLTHKK